MCGNDKDIDQVKTLIFLAEDLFSTMQHINIFKTILPLSITPKFEN
jgi:hypothetical protein